jgi:hypothetical protein
MQTSKFCYPTTLWLGLLFVAGCVTEKQSLTDPHTLAAGLACGELAGGSQRPFSDDGWGVTKTELRAHDLAHYDRESDDLRPDERVGVRYAVAAEAGSSETWLERRIHCYRAASVRTNVRDPLLVPTARVVVQSGSGRYFVDVTSRDRQTAREVLLAAGL